MRFAPPRAARPPTIRGERYVPLHPLARGGMSELWLARDPCLNRRVVLKEARADLDDAANRVCQASVLREAPILASLDHPCIVSVFDTYEYDGGHGLVLPFVDGTRLDQASELPVWVVLGVARQIADALAHMHRRGVVHLDLKRENVLLTPRGTPCIVDFGIAQPPGRVWQLPGTRGVPGTPRLMPPEQAAGREVDGRTDLFALGIMLSELFTRTASVPPGVSALIARLLESDPANRPADAAQVAAQLALVSPS